MRVVVGDVFFAFLSTIRKPKEKYFVVVCCEDPVRLVLINTVNAAMQLKNPALGPSQVYITPAELPCLSYASWIGCEELFSGYSYDDLVELAQSGASRGNVGHEVVRKIREALRLSNTIAERQKHRCLDAIREHLGEQGDDPA